MRHGIRACAYPAGVAVRPTSTVVATAAVCPSGPGLRAAQWDVIPAAQALPTSLFLLRRQPPLGADRR